MLERWLGGNGSIRQRLFLSAALCCLVILLVAGITLTTFYRRVAEKGFDERLTVYVKELVAGSTSVEPPSAPLTAAARARSR